MTFDAFGRETATVWDRLPATPGVVVDIWTNTYDDLGRLASVSSPTGEVLYEYDSQGRQIRVATRPNGFIPADADDVSTDIRYTYDLLGRLASVQTWERNDIAVDADPTAAGQQPETESYIYDVLGNLDRELNPDGTVTDYTFDDLNRLTDIDETRADGTKLSEYDYTLRADGKRDFAEEKFYAEDGSLISHTTFDWEYDAAGRMTDEIFTNVDGLLFDIDDYHTSFQYDLTGNRVGRTTITDTNNDGVIDEFADQVTQTDYVQDANDRITSETTYVDGSETTSATYGYDHTQQTSKEVFTNNSGFSELTSEQRFTYNVQGRLASAITETFEFGSINSRQRVSYRYGTDGIRFIATEEVDNVLDPVTENWTVA
ncbi:MAG: hypothetical protein NXI04_29940, partial [Planctomycetaceae bacterium]|nr:hypothetical protein [Planctomycetaceae bacterium]